MEGIQAKIITDRLTSAYPWATVGNHELVDMTRVEKIQISDLVGAKYMQIILLKAVRVSFDQSFPCYRSKSQLKNDGQSICGEMGSSGS